MKFKQFKKKSDDGSESLQREIMCLLMLQHSLLFVYSLPQFALLQSYNVAFGAALRLWQLRLQPSTNEVLAFSFIALSLL